MAAPGPCWQSVCSRVTRKHEQRVLLKGRSSPYPPGKEKGRYDDEKRPLSVIFVVVLVNSVLPLFHVSSHVTQYRAHLPHARKKTAKHSFDEILSCQAMLLVRKLVSPIEHMSYIASVAAVPRPFVSMLWSALTDHTQSTPKSNSTSSFKNCFFGQNRWSLGQMASCFVVSAGSTSANLHSESQTKYTAHADSH